MMKKLFSLSLALVLALALCVPCAQADPEDLLGQVFPDFAVATLNGTIFGLSDSLNTHDLVLINFWATWCGPCCMEFPSLETAWEQYSDRVDVIALSVEPSDTFDVLKGFARDNGLNFQIGRDDGGMFGSMGGSAIPTTLVVDKSRRVVAVEIGAKTSVEAFTGLFDSLLAASSSGAEPADRCVLTFCDPAGNPVPGVAVGFCNGEYTPVETDSSGRVTFSGDPNEYHVHLISVPAGYTKPWEQLQIMGDRFTLTVTLYPDNANTSL